jgi:Leucine-rich repeat (LRR) protein
MKRIVKGLLITLVMVLLYQCKKDPEPKFTIKDNNFLNALISQGADANGDDKISLDEAEVITYLDVSADSISDITGIEAFSNLDTLFCGHNQLSTLDIS